MADPKVPANPGKTGNTKLINLRGVKRKTKSMKDPELVIPADSYIASPTALGFPLFSEAARLECAGHDRPGFQEIGDYEDEPDTLTFRPCLTETDSTLKCRWDPANEALYIDMLPLLLARDIDIPKATNVNIPISRTKLSNGSEVVLVHLGKLTYLPKEKRAPRKKKTDTTGQNPDTPKA